MKLLNLFKRKPTLRECCQKKYGDEFIKLYDTLCDGVPIGNLNETVIFLNMVDAVRQKYKGQYR